MKNLFYVLLFLILLKCMKSLDENNITLFEIHPPSSMCGEEGVNLYLVKMNNEIPCVKCYGDGNLKTDGYRLFCENKTEGFCDYPTYFSMMFGDFPLCVRRQWWYGDDNNVDEIYFTYRSYKNI
mgnify:FL=1